MELIHPALDVLEIYALHRIPELELATIEEHLLVCSECQDRVSSLDRYHANLREALRQVEAEIHATEDGLIYNWVERPLGGRCKARHRGPMLDGGNVFATEREAWEYLECSFREMFPVHKCGRACSKRHSHETKREST